MNSCHSGQWVAGAVAYSGPAVLHPWLNLSILIEEIPTLLTTHYRGHIAGHMQAHHMPAEMAFA